MARSPSDAQDMDFQAKRSPSQPAAMMISGITHSNESPAPSVRATEEVPGVRHVQGNAEDRSEVGPAPKPCERCVRTEKTCRGVANARCEHCKRLKQKCSNSTGPARGKHAAAARLATGGASPSRGFPHVLAPGPSPRFSLQGQKRKLEDRQDGPSHRHSVGNSSPREEEESDDGHGVPARFNKKRRTAISSALIAARVLRQVKELEATVKRLEDVHAAEMEKVDTIIFNLTKDMEGFTADSELELSG